MDKLLETGKTPPPEKVAGPINDTALLEIINPLIEKERSEEDKAVAIGDSIMKTTERYNDFSSAKFADRYSPEARQAFIHEKSKPEFLTGYDFNYEYVNDARIGQDNKELQAQRQGWGAHLVRGVSRAVGEFALNVLETPGVVLGAAAGLATWDSSKMTENFWVKMTDGLKGDLQEALPVYQKRAVTEGGVMDHMLSSAWWASEGASGVAFMAAALIPGLGLTKLPKALSLTGKFARWGKSGQKVLRQLDKFAINTGAGSKAAVRAGGRGAAAKQGIDLFNVTMANTIYEAGVEARMAQQAYRDTIIGKYQNGEISLEEYDKLYANSSTVAARTFGANSLLLLGPNLVMSKMLLGKNALSSAQTAKRLKLNKKTNIFEKIEKPLIDTKGLKGLAKAKAIAKNTATQGAGSKVLGVGKILGSNYLREGVVEEMGQMAIEEYNTKGYIEEQLTGKRTKDFVQTYGKVLGSTEGQVAALLGGILGGGMGLVSGRQTSNNEKKQVDSMITSFNGAVNKFRAIKQDIYKRDDKGDVIIENGEPQIDALKLAQVGDAKTQIEYFTAIMDEMVQEGEHTKARALAENLQSQVFAPFASEGQAGLDMLKEVLESDPATDLALTDHNRIYGTAITKEAYVGLQMEKATNLKEDLFRYQNEYVRVLPNTTMRELGIERWSEEDKKATEIRDVFNMQETDRYTQYMSGLRNLKDERANAERKAKESKGRGEGKEEAYKKEIKAIDDLVADIEKNKNELLSEEKVEERFKKYYKSIQLADKINSKEVTGYLDTLISSIKSATSEEAVDELVKKAKKEGLILPGVEVDSLPKNLTAMLESTNINEVYGAFQILRAAIRRATISGGMASEQFDKYHELLIKATNQINSLGEKINIVLNSILEGASVAEERKTELVKKWQILHDKAAENIRAIDETSAEIRDLELKRIAEKRRKTKAHNDLLLKLAKEEKKARGLLKATNKEIDAINVEIRKELAIVAGMSDTLIAVTNTIDKKRVYNWIHAAQEAGKLEDGTVGVGIINSIRNNNTFIKIEKDLAIGNMPISVDDIIKAVTENKNILLEHTEKLGALVISAEVLEDLGVNRNTLLDMKSELERTLKVAKQLLQTFNSKSDANLQVSVRKVLEENYMDIVAEIDDIETRIGEIDSKIKKSTVDSSTAATMIERLEGMTSALEALDSGEYVYKKEKIEKPEEVTITKSAMKAAMGVIKNQLNDGIELDQSIEDLNKLLTQAIQLFGKDSLFVEFMEAIVKQAELALEDSNSVSSIPDFANFKTAKKKAPKKKKVTPTKEKTTEDAKKEIQTLFKEFYATLNPYTEATEVIEAEVVELEKGLANLEKELEELANEYKDLLGEDVINGFKDEILTLIAPAVKSARNKVKKGGTGTVTIINNAPGIGRILQDIIDEKKQDVQLKKLEELRAKASEEWTFLQKKEDDNKNAFSLQEEAHFVDSKGTKHKGVILDLIESENKVTNVVLQDSSGKLHVTLFTKLFKDELTPQEYNDTLIQKKEDAWKEERSNTLVGGHNAVSISIQMDRKSNRTDQKTGKIVENRHAFLDYLQNIDDEGKPRDKSEDVIHFGINIGTVASKAARKGSFSPARDVHTKKTREIKAVYDKVINGGFQKLSKEEQEYAFAYLVDELPLTLRVFPKVGGKVSDNGAAGARLDGRSKEDGNFNELDKPLRESIIGTWLSSGAYVEDQYKGISNKMSGVEANWSYLRQGLVNNSQVTKDAGGTMLHELQGQNLVDLNLVAIKSLGEVYTRKAKVDNIDYFREGSEGLIFLQTKDLQGEPFLLAIEQRNFEGTKELDTMMSMLDEVFKEDSSIAQSTEVPANILEEMPEKLRAAFKASNLPITYGLVFKTLVTPASEGTPYRVSLEYSKKIITIGGDVFQADTFNKDRDAIKTVLGSLKQRVSFVAKNKEALTIDNEAYFDYIIKEKVLYSNIPAGEPLFTGLRRKEGNKTYLDGIAPLLGPSTVYGTVIADEVKKGIKEEKKKPIKEVKKIRLTREATALLRKANVKGKSTLDAIPNGIKQKLNSLTGNVEVKTILQVYKGLTGNESDTEKRC